ncbi:MAG: imidazole glycerol phosphate synthase subunit HisF, partial [Flavobacteriales bacterium]|nr:imidazole glycerol phosphate synthase subunit HisF [Flavobacteriales bacterium]
LRTVEWAKKIESLGAGEILLTSMQHDGTKAGFSCVITEQVASAVSIPVIASGGAGKPEDFEEVFTKTRATGALAASIFHFSEIPIPELKLFLDNKNIPIRCS